MRNNATTLLVAIATLLLSLLVSCTKDSSLASPSSIGGATLTDNTPCSLTVGVQGTVLTRSTSISSDDEVAVSSLQVLVFRPDGALDAYGTVDNDTEITLSCTAGSRTAYAVVNAPSLASVSSEAGLLSTATLLSENSASAFQMIGSRTVTLPQAQTVTIDVERIVSRISIKSVTRSFTSASLAAKTFTIDEVFLVNVAGDNVFSLDGAPSTWFNQRAYSSEQAAFTHDAPAQSMENGATYSTVHSFYAYPNPTVDDSSETTWSARHTRLVLKTTLGTDTYYYPITLPSLEPNKSYEIENLTITRPGSDSPDVPVSFADCTFDLHVLDWTVVPVADPASESVTI